MGSIIVVTSGKGGTGKTACTAGVGAALALLGKRVLLVDCDVGLRNLDLALGLPDVMWDFGDVLRGDISFDDAAAKYSGLDGLDFLAAPSEASPADVDRDSFRSLLSELSPRYDFILLDSPAGLGTGFDLAAGSADSALLVANSDATSLRDGARTSMKLREKGVTEQRLIINRVDSERLSDMSVDLDDVIDAVGVRLIGAVSEDPSVQLALSAGEPLMLYGAKLAFDQFMRIARRLAGERLPLGKL